MKKETLEQKASRFLDELEENRELEYDISYRGGTLGITSEKFIESWYAQEALHCDDDPDFYLQLLPNKIGAYVNYLGGGLRGSICGSIYSSEITENNKRLQKRLNAFIDACIRRYEEIETESHLNDETSPDGEINWEATGTKKIRENGICSAY